MNNNNDAVYIQQLRKYCKDNKTWNEIFPVTFIQAIYNAANGNRLDTLLAMYNSIFVEYKGSFATTVAAIDNIVRKKGLIITYFDENNLSWTRRYKLHDTSDINFQNEDNWEGYNFDILVDEIYKAIEYIFTNIDKFPDLKNVLIQQITEVTENIFNNIEDYTNLYNIFKELIKENINNVFNNINDYTNLKNLINTNIYNRVDYIFNNIDDFKVLLNKINVAILNRVDYIFNNINNYPELKQLIINSLQAKQLFTIEFSVNGDTLDIINKDELNSYIENNNVNNNALFTFIGNFFDSSNNKLLYNLVFTAFVNTNSNYLNLDNCYGETLIINNGKLYKYKINFNINTKTEMSNPNWITYARKYDDIPTFEFNYISTNIYSIANIDDYNKYVNSFKYNTLVRFIFNESSTTINEYIGYISKVGSTLRILIYLQESNDFVYDTIISGIIENNKLRINRLTNSDILTYLYNANSSGGVVLLDDDTLIPSRFLPSYVDDVIDLLGGIVESTPTSGMTAGYKYYVTSTKKIFTASSATSGITSDPISDVIYVVPDDINGTIMYRWSGTTLVEIINSGIVIGTTTGTAFDGARGLNNENILKSVPNKLITDVSVIAQGPNDDVIIRTTYSERINNDGSYVANKYRDYQLPEAQQGSAGLMSSSDKIKLDSINTVDVLNTIMSGLVLKPTSGNQFETNQRYSSSDTLIQLINKFIQNSGYNDFRIVHSPLTINFVFGTTINNSNPNVNVLSFTSNLLVGNPVLRIYSKSINFSEVATLTYTELNNSIRDGSWQSFELDLSNIGSGGSDYTLPIASATTLGGIKIPANGHMTIDENGNLYPNVATRSDAGIVNPGIKSGLSMNGSSISVTLGRKNINLGTLTPGSTIIGGRYYIYDDLVAGNASPRFKLNNNIDSWEDPLAIIIVNRKNGGGVYFDGTNINMLTATNDCTKIGAIFIRYYQNNNENGYFVWAVPNVIR